jgi:fatty aldehyde-generating acyl-ACP reductase
MDSMPASLDFAVIGHQESWQNISAFVNSIRNSEQEALSSEKIKNIYSFIPPRDIFRVKVRSKTGAEINGVYIETFIDPDKLGTQFIRTNISKVMSAVSCAKKLKAKITTLGGFTSIVLEGDIHSFTASETNFTTGNTLTAAYIVKGIEKAAGQLDIHLNESAVLIVGATGDIGMACCHYLKKKVRKLLLCARNQHRLDQFAGQLRGEHIRVNHSVDLHTLLPAADVVICVASSTDIKLVNCKIHVLICDAGHPKNLCHIPGNHTEVHLFHGGMGQVSCGYEFTPDYTKSIHHYKTPHIMHGCILEAMILAFENRFENYSSAKGNITIDKMEEIYSLSLKHGVKIAPFYNAERLWQEAAITHCQHY